MGPAKRSLMNDCVLLGPWVNAGTLSNAAMPPPNGVVESGRDGTETSSHSPWQQFSNPINWMVGDVREDVA